MRISVRRGVTFDFVRWEVNEDGLAGAIYFRAPEGVLRINSNNGASHWLEPDENKPNVRMATPCMEHGESFFKMKVMHFINEAVDTVMLNLSSDYTERFAPGEVCYSVVNMWIFDDGTKMHAMGDIDPPRHISETRLEVEEHVVVRLSRYPDSRIVTALHGNIDIFEWDLFYTQAEAEDLLRSKVS